MRIILAPTLIFAGLVMIAACHHEPTAVIVVANPIDCSLLGPSVSPASATLVVGDTLRASAHDNSCADGSAIPIAGAAWISSDSTVARVDSLSGLVHARAVGQVTIVAFLISDPIVKGAMAVNVVAR